MIESILSKLNAIPADKTAHFASGAVLFALAVPFMGPVYAFAAVAAAGVAKELYDLLHKQTHTPDVWDAIATALGGAFGLFCTFF